MLMFSAKELTRLIATDRQGVADMLAWGEDLVDSWLDRFESQLWYFRNQVSLSEISEDEAKERGINNPQLAYHYLLRGGYPVVRESRQWRASESDELKTITVFRLR